MVPSLFTLKYFYYLCTDDLGRGVWGDGQNTKKAKDNNLPPERGGYV